MTYQHTAPATPILGHIRAIGAGLGEFFHSLGRAIEVNSTAHRRLNQVHSLQARSDAELAALGIERDRIVHHVFRDLYYI
jgi:hypothetical protein